MIRRDLHPICSACWDKIVGIERWKVRDLHHFFTFDAHPECCWCGSPAHGQWWKAPRLDVPCQGMWGFHQFGSVVVDLDEIKSRYYDSDKEVIALVDLAQALQREVATYEQTHTEQKDQTNAPN